MKTETVNEKCIFFMFQNTLILFLNCRVMSACGNSLIYVIQPAKIIL